MKYIQENSYLEKAFTRSCYETETKKNSEPPQAVEAILLFHWVTESLE